MDQRHCRKLKDTSVFKTDVRQVFDFIRCSEDKKKLKELVDGNEYYKNMEEDACAIAECSEELVKEVLRKQ